MNYTNFANRIQSNGSGEVTITMQDLSPSMDEKDWKPNRLAGAIAANEKLLDIKLKHYPNDQMGVIGFAGSAKLLHSPAVISRNAQSLRKAFNQRLNEYGTNFTAALELAESCFFPRTSAQSGNVISRMLSELFVEPESKTPVSAKSIKRIILLTDGEHNQGGSPLPVATRLKDAGVIIDCIGIGGSPQAVDEALLKEIASRNPDGSVRYCFIGDQDQLIRKYESLATHIKPV
ncbi:MAG: VWA domain-containing protein [Anaerohalosphaera sp.]|nr:VWA domain-containing protein [Anaerohalosphaera sp.]